MKRSPKESFENYIRDAKRQKLVSYKVGDVLFAKVPREEILRYYFDRLCGKVVDGASETWQEKFLGISELPKDQTRYERFVIREINVFNLNNVALESSPGHHYANLPSLSYYFFRHDDSEFKTILKNIKIAIYQCFNYKKDDTLWENGLKPFLF